MPDILPLLIQLPVMMQASQSGGGCAGRYFSHSDAAALIYHILQSPHCATPLLKSNQSVDKLYKLIVSDIFISLYFF